MLTSDHVCTVEATNPLQLKHEGDIVLEIPAHQSKWAPSMKEVEPNRVDYRGCFDGRCQRKVALGGYLLFDHEG